MGLCLASTGALKCADDAPPPCFRPFVPQAMVECSQERLFSVVWACRGQLNALNTCLGGWTGAEGLEDAKRRWVRAGRLDDWHTDLWPEDAAERAAFERRKSERLGGKKSAKDDARKSRLSGGGSMGGGG